MGRDANMTKPGGVHMIKNMCVRAHINGLHIKCVRPWGQVCKKCMAPQSFGWALCGTSLHMP